MAEWHWRWSLTGTLAAVERPTARLSPSLRALGRHLSPTYRGKTTHWIWDGNGPLHEWIELTPGALARDGEPLRTSFEREIAQAKREPHLSRRRVETPPELVYPTLGESASVRGAASAAELDSEVPLLEGTVESPITWLFEPGELCAARQAP